MANAVVIRPQCDICDKRFVNGADLVQHKQRCAYTLVCRLGMLPPYEYRTCLVGAMDATLRSKFLPVARMMCMHRCRYLAL